MTKSKPRRRSADHNRVLLLTPPLLQVNTPYAATPFLTGFLRSRGIPVQQADLSLELVCRLFSRSGLSQVAACLRTAPSAARKSAAVRQFLRFTEEYLATIDPVMAFLRGQEPTLAHRLASRRFLPEGPRFTGLSEDYLHFAFGTLGVQDQAKHLASLYVDDLVDVVHDGIDPAFGLARYAESLAASLPEIDPLLDALRKPPTLLDRWMDELATDLLARCRPDVVGLTVPFPGTLYGALRIAATMRRLAPKAMIVVGGGYVSTELRQIRDPRLFDYVDYLILDDGYRPLECLLEHLAGKRPAARLLRTFRRQKGKVEYCTTGTEHDLPLEETGTPTYEGLPLDRYFSLVEMLNPMHRLWSDGRWQKLLLAHGCYWHRCAFCDTSLDYIRRYDPATAERTVERMLALMAETHETGFHFVDEAAPPALLKRLSEILLERRITVSWWVNIRFEPGFTRELTELMAAAGCIAVTGGLESASDRLLDLMAKGISVEQASRCLHHFSQAGIMVHAYLMYGFPTQTVQETVDGLDRVRQWFAAGCLDSAYWHRFAATIHSPVGHAPADFGICPCPKPAGSFAQNAFHYHADVATTAPVPDLGPGLAKALYNFMLGIGLDEEVRTWFDVPVPKTKVPRGWLRRVLAVAAAVKAGQTET